MNGIPGFGGWGRGLDHPDGDQVRVGNGIGIGSDEQPAAIGIGPVVFEIDGVVVVEGWGVDGRVDLILEDIAGAVTGCADPEVALRPDPDPGLGATGEEVSYLVDELAGIERGVLHGGAGLGVDPFAITLREPEEVGHRAWGVFRVEPDGEPLVRR